MKSIEKFLIEATKEYGSEAILTKEQVKEVCKTAGTNSFGYQVGLTADRTCVAKNIPLSQCIEYGEESTASANGWVWGLSEGCHFGANSCQATEGNYGTTPKAGVDTTTNFEYTLPPANYPGYNPPKGSYKLDITQFVIGVFFGSK